MSISPGNKNSLLSYIRLLSINPYNIDRNPYKSLSRGFLLYNGAYPIRYEQDKNHIAIAKNPLGVNIRLYDLSVGALRCFSINKNINYYNFDVWREIKYYEYIREDILKRKVCPNFVALYLYTIDSTSRIDYEKLGMIKYNSLPKGLSILEKQNEQKINELHEFNMSEKLLSYVLKPKALASQENLASTENRKEDITESSLKTLVALTEAPNCNIIQWASPRYEPFGSIKKMVETGYHSENVWFSVLFQLTFACAVLQEKGIYFHNFSLENNVFIKDLFTDPNNIGHWVYQINDMDFYIPNYGYLAMIDSRYVDIYEETNKTIDIKKEQPVIYKIASKELFGDENGNMDIDFERDLIKTKIMIQFKEIINPDNYTNKLKIMRGSKLDDNILDLLKKMYMDTKETDIGGYLEKYFPFYLNNRVGTLLTKNEKDILPLISDITYNRGELVAYQERFGEYKWAVFIDNNADGIRKDIKIKDEQNQYKVKPVFPHSLFKYPINERIQQSSNKTVKLNDEFRLETYNIKNLE